MSYKQFCCSWKQFHAILHKLDTHQVYFATLVHLVKTHKYRQQTTDDLIRLHQYNTLLWCCLVRWINHLNKQQTSIDSTPPCLTPLDTWNGSDKWLPHFICIGCPLYQCFITRTKHIGTFLWISFSNNFMSNTRWNVFEAAKTTTCTYEPWVTKYDTVCFNKNIHWSVSWPALKPNWLSVVPRNGEMLDNITCSSGFDTTVATATISVARAAYGPCPPKFLEHSHFVLWEAVSQTK